MGSLLTLLLPALVPALADGVRGLIGRVTGGAGAQPQNVAEQIQLWQAQTDRLRALAELDKPAGDVSHWVSDLRAAFRYLAISAIWLTTVAAIFTHQDAAIVAVLLDMTGATMSFVIGERMYLGLKK